MSSPAATPDPRPHTLTAHPARSWFNKVTKLGIVHSTKETWVLWTRAIAAFCAVATAKDGVARRALLDEVRTWLPTAEALAHIIRHEWQWEAFPNGLGHPALSCAALHFESGDSRTARAIVEDQLSLSANPPSRIEALRLLARVASADGDHAVAVEALEKAAAEAEAVGFYMLAALSLRDLLGLPGWASEAAGAAARAEGRARLGKVLRRLSASDAELEEFFVAK